MFYYINGELALTELNAVVIDCGGVGYKLTVSGTTLSKLSGKINQKVKLFTYLAVREDDIELFGFFTQEELASFKMLISVSGVGPKAAMSILSLHSPERFAVAVTTGDTKALSKAAGIGAKTAARIVLELKDKIAKEMKIEIAYGDSELTETDGSKLSDAMNTLMVLGYTRSEALAALHGINIDTLSLEDVIKESLKKLMRK